MHRYISIEETEFRTLEALAEAAKSRNIGILFERVSEGVVVNINNYPLDDSELPERIKRLFDSYSQTINTMNENRKREFEARDTANSRAMKAELDRTAYQIAAENAEQEVKEVRKQMKFFKYASMTMAAALGILIAEFLLN